MTKTEYTSQATDLLQMAFWIQILSIPYKFRWPTLHLQKRSAGSYEIDVPSSVSTGNDWKLSRGHDRPQVGDASLWNSGVTTPLSERIMRMWQYFSGHRSLLNKRAQETLLFSSLCNWNLRVSWSERWWEMQLHFWGVSQHWILVWVTFFF